MKTTKKRCILVIEDSELNIVTLTNILSPDHDVIVARDGYDGIAMAQKECPDVILLDIVMPKMDGFKVITALRASILTRKIPVIFISGLSNVKDEEKGLALGGVDYISKPFNEEIVKLRVNNQIRILDYIDTIEQLSQTDQLTGLNNRRSFDERLYSEWKRTARDGLNISLLLIDIDHFKKINDTYGHLQGDVVLQKVANTIAGSLRRSSDFSARWGGEEFIVMLPNTNTDGAVIVAEFIRKNIEGLTVVFPDEQSTTVTVSIGVCASEPTVDCSVDDLLQGADSALYAAKEGGRNRVLVHD